MTDAEGVLAELSRRALVYEADLLRIIEHSQHDDAKAIACGVMYLSTLITSMMYRPDDA